MVLFLACLGFYLSYYPFAANFRHYMAATGEVHDIEGVFESVLPGMGSLPGNLGVSLGNPFLLYAWYALTGLTLALPVTVALSRRARAGH